MSGKSFAESNFGTENYVQKNLGKKIGLKNIWFEKNVEEEKIWAKTNYETKKCMVKKIWVQKLCWFRKNLGSKTFG